MNKYNKKKSYTNIGMSLSPYKDTPKLFKLSKEVMIQRMKEGSVFLEDDSSNPYIAYADENGNIILEFWSGVFRGWYKAEVMSFTDTYDSIEWVEFK